MRNYRKSIMRFSGVSLYNRSKLSVSKKGSIPGI